MLKDKCVGSGPGIREGRGASVAPATAAAVAGNSSLLLQRETVTVLAAGEPAAAGAADNKGVWESQRTKDQMEGGELS